MRRLVPLLLLLGVASPASAADLTWTNETPVLLVEPGPVRAYRIDGPEGARFTLGDGPDGRVPASVELAPGAYPVKVRAPESGWLLVVPTDPSEGGVAIPVESEPQPGAGNATEAVEPPGEQAEGAEAQTARPEGPRAGARPWRVIPAPGIGGAVGVAWLIFLAMAGRHSR